jgi:hypothetical protein
MRMRHLILPALLLTGSGCGESGPTLVPVNGTVTLNGKPLEGAEIAFIPDPGNKAGLPALDVTGPEGNYKAMSLNRSGVVPGKYKVIITKMPTASKSDAASTVHRDDPFMAQIGNETAAAAAKGAGVRKKDVVLEKIEQKYDAEVEARKNTLDFDVKASAKAASK